MLTPVALQFLIDDAPDAVVSWVPGAVVVARRKGKGGDDDLMGAAARLAALAPKPTAGERPAHGARTPRRAARESAWRRLPARVTATLLSAAIFAAGLWAVLAWVSRGNQYDVEANLVPAMMFATLVWLPLLAFGVPALLSLAAVAWGDAVRRVARR